MRKTVQRAFDRFGRLDIGINSAAECGFAPIQNYRLSEWDRVISTCLTGTYLCIKHQAARMIAQGEGGSIVNITSLNAIQPSKGFAACCSAKAGVDMLTKVTALELRQFGIRVNSIGPDLVHTEATTGLTSRTDPKDVYIDEMPMGRLGETADISPLALYLASKEARFMTGQSLYIDGASVHRYPRLFSFLDTAAAGRNERE